jgi:hypothetical protein
LVKVDAARRFSLVALPVSSPPVNKIDTFLTQNWLVIASVPHQPSCRFDVHPLVHFTEVNVDNKTRLLLVVVYLGGRWHWVIHWVKVSTKEYLLISG